MRRTSFEDMACPLARTADTLGDSWSVLILREVFYGHHRFDEFVTELGIASNTLTRRLAELVNRGLLEKRQYSDKPPRHEYLLTPKGRDLRPVMLALLTWGNLHAPLKNKPVRLIDTETGEPVELKLIDARTGKAIGPQHKVERRSGSPRRVEVFDFDGEVDKAEAAD
ncbi:helix-turn-helix domain-containing protein [Mitsuaria sp. GD03876]|uniref:winged helix-turn-helix transcriptional regulator n=1 Tax=Mitsuaria sp. GD03876 TaxID=2975399 RepID=UPI0024485AAD|nr:helix-turn-helix domain-containing protein [Mitsuaria sp. GD03876]MDH0864714.1 helix-turn-helix transcriptional regulator [Mitsuaria sp. GD03876]